MVCERQRPVLSAPSLGAPHVTPEAKSSREATKATPSIRSDAFMSIRRWCLLPVPCIVPLPPCCVTRLFSGVHHPFRCSAVDGCVAWCMHACELRREVPFGDEDRMCHRRRGARARTPPLRRPCDLSLPRPVPLNKRPTFRAFQRAVPLPPRRTQRIADHP